MKFFFTISFLIFAGFFNSFAQNPIPNASFENWTPYTGGVCTPPNQNPTGWQTSDQTYCGFISSHSAVQDVEHCGASGNFSIKLITITGFGIIGPGVATNGTIVSSTSVNGGSPDTARSTMLTGCYKYQPAGTDTGLIAATLFRWNTSTVKRDTIAVAYQQYTATTSTMTSFSIPFNYFIAGPQPDTILILLLSSPGLGRGVAGSALTVDDLDVSGFIGIEENSVIKNVNVYPSPASNELNIDVTYKVQKKTYFNLYDGIGKNVLSGEMKGSQQKVNITSLSNGIYMLSLTGEAGEKLYSTKVTVTH